MQVVTEFFLFLTFGFYVSFVEIYQNLSLFKRKYSKKVIHLYIYHGTLVCLFSFHFYIYSSDLQQSNGDTIHRAKNYPAHDLYKATTYCCLVEIFLFWFFIFIEV